MGALAILIASFLWGTTGTAASYAPDVSPFAIGAFATGFGGLLQAIRTRRAIRADWEKLRTMVPLIIVGALAVAAYPLTFYLSMALAGVALGTLVCIATAPFAAVFMERFLSPEPQPLSKRWLLAMAFGLGGIALLCYGKPQGNALLPHPYKLAGIAVGIMGGFTYAGYTRVARMMIQKNVRSGAAMGTLFGLAAVLLLPSLLITGGPLFSSGKNLLVGSYMALLPMFVGYILFGIGLRTIEASSATLLSLFEPLVATLLAVTLVKERLSHSGWFGIALITVSLLLISWPKRQRPPKGEPTHPAE